MTPDDVKAIIREDHRARIGRERTRLQARLKEAKRLADNPRLGDVGRSMHHQIYNLTAEDLAALAAEEQLL